MSRWDDKKPIIKEKFNIKTDVLNKLVADAYSFKVFCLMTEAAGDIKLHTYMQILERIAIETVEAMGMPENLDDDDLFCMEIIRKWEQWKTANP